MKVARFQERLETVLKVSYECQTGTQINLYLAAFYICLTPGVEQSVSMIIGDCLNF